VVAVPTEPRQAMDRRASQLLAKLSAGIDEGGSGDMQSHHLHHHLIRIGGAVKGTGACAMIGSSLCPQEFGLAGFPFLLKLPHPLLLLVGEARRHRPPWYENRRQMPEPERTD